MYQDRKVSGHVFVLGGPILSLSTILIFAFGIVPTLWGFFSHFIDNGTVLVVIEHWFISVVIDQP
jgi:hypothetical protein